MPPTTMPTIAPTPMPFFSSSPPFKSSIGWRSATSPSTGRLFPVLERDSLGFMPLNLSFGPEDFPPFAGPAFAR